ncbi:hypothetical protein [Nesterenkonia ebinurensis]|uniref:hypothetical protein n=1 Tax=Nesterenkonia ebinurensis TaxID=2608252 RepID=UPI00123D5053|nr:hypothetical protein [Nesterenkonia ebinurensis]
MPKLYLHAGTYKTGTTALQKFAHANRMELLARGVFYADYGKDPMPLPFGHHRFALAVTRQKTEVIERLTRIVEHWKTVAETEGVPVLFSSENLFMRRLESASPYWEARTAYMQRLADLLESFDVEPIIVYRRPDDFARSLYQERVTNGLKRLPKFHEWIANGDPMLEYTKNTSIIAEKFRNGHHFIYEELSNDQGIYAGFFDSIGVSIEGLETPSVVRKSLSPAETVIKNYANKFISAVPEGRDFVNWMRQENLAREIEESHKHKLALWRSPKERADFLASRKEDIEQLRKKFFSDRGDAKLFPELQEGDAVYEVPQLPHTVIAEVEKYFKER